MKANDTLKKLRQQKNMTQSEVADAIEVSLSSYQKYERDKNTVLPSLEVLTRIADFYNVSLDYLLGREAAPNPFSDLNLSEEDEANVVAKYMSLPPEIRACMLDVLVQLGDAAKKRQPEPDPDDTDYITVSTTLGEIEDRRKEDANSKDGA